jgi:N-acetylmuramoyl-L-alanine amidase
MGKKVYLIAGHNGTGTGANGFIDEGKENIIIRDLIYDKLLSFGIKAIKDDNLTPLTKVVQWLRNIVSKDDICIDIHFNSSPNIKANGSEAFIPTKNTEDERILARMFSTTMGSVMGTTDRGVSLENKSYHGKIAMLSGFDCCNVLLEICFVTNQRDCELYQKNKDELASELALDILEFIRSF